VRGVISSRIIRLSIGGNRCLLDKSILVQQQGKIHEMVIKELNLKDKSAWDEYVLNHPHGNVYHLPAWKDAVEKAYKFKGCYLIAKNDTRKENSIKGILPLVHHHLPFLKGKFISLPFCDAAGPLADSEDIEKALLKEAIKIAHQKRIKKITIRSTKPFAGIDEEQIINKIKVRMLLNLPDKSEKLLATFKSKLRSQIKKPIRDGLTVKIGNTELLSSFYPLFAENMHDLGSPVHSLQWIESILQNYGNRAHLVLVRMPDKTPAAGGIILCHPNQVSVPWASSLRCFNRWNPNMLLYWSFLKFSCDMGYPVFDFGRSTPGEGTYRFKKQWGAKTAPLFWSTATINSNLWINNHLSGKSKYTGADEYWKKLPLPATKMIGPFLRKYISL
jgi:FemAB-related protein (PEP-CTERM system-associated)